MIEGPFSCVIIYFCEDWFMMFTQSKMVFFSLTLLAGLSLAACEVEGPNGTSTGGVSAHNAGRNCLQSGCHTNLKYAGTIYTDAAGSSGASNASIVVTEADGTNITMTAGNNGTFYSDSGNPSGGYTVTVTGNSLDMVTNPTSGGCSAGGCHDGSATALVYTN